MKNLFVPYEIAKQLKEKGFNEVCFTNYSKNATLMSVDSASGSINTDLSDYEDCSAPLYQQVIDWFRNTHKIIIESRPLNTLGWWDALIYNQECERIYRDGGYKTYYEALTKAIEEAIKLIN